MNEADGGGAAEAPILEEGSDGVRLMTVHKAKGLEFPVVILADPTCKLTARNASRTLDPDTGLCAIRIGGWSPAELLERQEEERRRDDAEAIRVSYVAATRARDLLVIPGVGDQPYDEWVGPLNSAIYPSRDQWRSPGKAAGCPQFGEDTVVHRPDHFIPQGMKPGRHSNPAGHDVVWWDPEALRLQVAPVYGVRHTDLIGKDIDDSLVEQDLATHREWRRERQEVLQRAGEAEHPTRVATERAAEPVAGEEAVEVVTLEVAASRPAGPRFGALVHGLLASVPLDAEGDRLTEAAEMHGRILGCPAPEVSAAVTCVSRVLGESILGEAREAHARGECRRECPVVLREGDGTLVEGVLDLTFRGEDGSWRVIDFKTDRELADDLERYRRQVAIYVEAVQNATGEPAHGILLRV